MTTADIYERAAPILERMNNVTIDRIDVEKGKPGWFYEAATQIALFAGGEEVVYLTHGLTKTAYNEAVEQGKAPHSQLDLTVWVTSYTATRLIRTRISLYGSDSYVDTEFIPRQALISVSTLSVSSAFVKTNFQVPLVKQIQANYGDFKVTLPAIKDDLYGNNDGLDELLDTLIRDQLTPLTD